MRFFLAFFAFLIFFITVNQAEASRPPSGSCPFEGVVESINDKTHPMSNLQQLGLEVRLIKAYSDGLCESLNELEVLEMSWYVPDAKLPSGNLYRPGQPEIDLEQLTPGVRIRGDVDSYDKIVSNLIILGTNDESDKHINGVEDITFIEGYMLKISAWIKSAISKLKYSLVSSISGLREAGYASASAILPPTCFVTAEVIEISENKDNFLHLRVLSISDQASCPVVENQIYRATNNYYAADGYPGSFSFGDTIKAGVQLGSANTPLGAASYLHWSEITNLEGDDIPYKRGAVSSLESDNDPIGTYADGLRYESKDNYPYFLLIGALILIATFFVTKTIYNRLGTSKKK